MYLLTNIHTNQMKSNLLMRGWEHYVWKRGLQVRNVWNNTGLWVIKLQHVECKGLFKSRVADFILINAEIWTLWPSDLLHMFERKESNHVLNKNSGHEMILYGVTISSQPSRLPVTSPGLVSLRQSSFLSCGPVKSGMLVLRDRTEVSGMSLSQHT